MATRNIKNTSASPGVAADSISQDKQLHIMSEIPRSYVWVLSAFIALVSIVAPMGQNPFGYNPDLYMAAMLQIGALAFLSIYLFFVYKNRNTSIYVPRIPLLIYPVGAFYLWMLLSLFWAHNFYEAIVKVLDWGAAIIIFFLILMALRDRRSLFPIVFCLFCSLVAVALLGVGQYLFSVDWVAQHASPAATFGNKNMNGEYLILTWVLGVGLFINSRNLAASWFYGLGCAFAIAALFYTRTRGSWVAFLVEVIVLAILLIYFKYRLAHPYHWGIFKVLALLGFLVFTVALINLSPQFFVQSIPVIEENTGGIDKQRNPSGGAIQAETPSELVKSALSGFSATGNQRVIMWRNSLNMLRDHWFRGVGIGNWMVYYPKYQESYAVDPALRGETLFHINAHNDYVEFICELGLVGILLMVWVVFSALIGLGRAFSIKSKLRREEQTIIMSCVAALFGVAANAAVSFPLQQPITIAITVLFVGILSAAVWHAAPATQRTYYRLALPSPVFNAAAAFTAATATLVMLAVQTIWYKSDSLYFKAVSNYSSGHYRSSFAAAQESYKEFPIRKRTMYYIGNYYYRHGDYDKALPIFEEMREDYPYRRQVLNALAGVYLELGKMQELDALLEEWSTYHPRSASVQLTKGIAAIRKNKLQEAVSILEKAQKMNGSGTTHKKIKSILQKLYRATERIKASQINKPS